MRNLCRVLRKCCKVWNLLATGCFLWYSIDRKITGANREGSDMKHLGRILAVLVVAGGIFALVAALCRRRNRQDSGYVTLYDSGVEF